MKSINNINQFEKTILFIVKKNPLFFFLFLVGLLFSLLIACIDDWRTGFFANFFDPFTSVMTLLVAAIIALENYQKSWKAELPKTLTVHFKYKGKYQLSCYFADLTSEGDIRTWAQQIGSRMTNSARLDFNPFIYLDNPKVISLSPNQMDVLHYEITILFKSQLDSNSEEGKNAFEIDQYKRWYVRHDKEGEDRLLELPIIEPIAKLPDFNYEVMMQEIAKQKGKADV